MPILSGDGAAAAVSLPAEAAKGMQREITLAITRSLLLLRCEGYMAFPF